MNKLLRLHLENYRNITNLDLAFGGSSGSVYGANRAGKTNVLEAIAYLLTDRLLGGAGDVASIKPRGNSRAKVVVEGEILTSQGKITVRKEFYERWVRPRGSDKEELAGHSTDYYVNGAKQARAKDFEALLAEKLGVPLSFGGLDPFLILTDPFYVGETVCGGKDWKEARKAVVDIIGDPLPDEVFEKAPAAKIAKGDLERHQWDDGEAKKAIRGEIEGHKKEAEKDLTLKEEYEKAENITERERLDAEAEERTLSGRLASLRAGQQSDPYAEEESALNRELAGLNARIMERSKAKVDRSGSEAAYAEIQSLRKRLQEAEGRAKEEGWNRERDEKALLALREEYQGYEKRMGDLRSEFGNIVVEKACPTCGQPLPEEEIERAYNAKRAAILSEAEAVKEKAKQAKLAINLLESRLAKEAEEKAKKEAEALRAELERAGARYEGLLKEEAERAKALLADDGSLKRADEIKARLGEIDALRAMGLQGKLGEMRELEEKRQQALKTLAKRENYLAAMKRAEELGRKAEAEGRAQADAEQRLWAVGEFVRAKLSLLDERMAERLGEVRFQLVRENIRAGSYDEVCVPYIVSPKTGLHTDTPFRDGSTSERIYTGAMIAKAIRAAKGWEELPILVDQGGELDRESERLLHQKAMAQVIGVKVLGTSETPIFEPAE